ncbi:hypothetical protein O6H91_23G002800 [Diphasiastrum complanatum]|uniref:Uncharacterized protein n=1 Tax=Diphasiastrum complanatum TaxID=34168 RepID=A0ACC2A7J9_DIPCM|nr:hypothetical protein O6H91_23G002800 [Diphasiastrum complanatum]
MKSTMDSITTTALNNMQDKVERNSLPPGFRFHPTDEELVNEYLKRKILHPNFTVRAILEVDLNKCEPWDLPGRSKMGEKEWYFFNLRDRKYPTGLRTNRATESGYWKATGKDREVYCSRSVTLVGMKKTLVFYKGRAPKGEKTNWIMHEYRLEGDSESLHLRNSGVSKDSEWVVCRIFHKMPGGKKAVLKTNIFKGNFMSICEEEMFLPPLHECPLLTYATDDPGLQSDEASSFANENVTISASSSKATQSFGHWIAREKRSADMDSTLLEIESSSFEIGSNMLKYPSYMDSQLMNVQTEEVSISNMMRKIKREQESHTFPLLTTNRTLWNEHEQCGKDIAVDCLVDTGALTTPCKIEPYLEVNEALEGGHLKMLENNVWTEGGTDFECPQLLNLIVPLESSLIEISEEISPNIYRNGISSTEDLDSLWPY